MTKYAAGWDMPGCPPESDPERFDSFSDAVNYLIGIVDLFWVEDIEDRKELRKTRSAIDARWKPLYNALANAANDKNGTSFAGCTGDESYAFWVVRKEGED